MATLPDASLRERPTPQPQTGLVSYQATTGTETLPGQALASLGHDVLQVAKELELERERQDTTRVEDAWNKYKNTALDVTIGDKGVLKTQGADAVNGNILRTTNTTLEASKKSILETLGNENQRKRFTARAATTDLQVKHQVLTHLEQQEQAYAQTVLLGSEAAAKAQIGSAPASMDVFESAKSTLLMQADAYLARRGVDDKDAIASYKAKLTDALWATRIDALNVTNPILADAVFRANQTAITDPALRHRLQQTTREGAVTMQASQKGDQDVNEAIGKLIQRTARATPEGGPNTGLMTDTGVQVPKSVRNNNPGNIVDVKTGEIRTFATPEAGAKALDAEIRLKLAGNSPAYKARFGTLPVTPERLAETWAPAAAKGNSAASTTNYAAAIATAVGIKPGDPIPNTPDAIGKVKTAIAAFEAGAYGTGGTQRVGSNVATAQQYSTSGTPTARDVAALLPVLLSKAEARADELYGPDTSNPDRFAFLTRYQAQIKAQLASKVSQLTAIQQDYLNDVADFVQGLSPQAGLQGGTMPVGGGRAGGPGMMRVTSIPMLQAASPEMFQKFQRLDTAGKQTVAVLMEAAQRADERGNPALYNEFRNRINLPPDDPNKINWIQNIAADPRVQAGQLTQGQWASLRAELKEASTDDGRSQAAVKKAGEALVRNQFRGNMVLTAAGTDYGKAEYAQSLWAQNADKVVGQYKAANKDIRPLFYADSPESLVSPRAIAQFATRAGAVGTAQMLSEMAAKGTTQQPPVQQPPEIDTREKLNAWFQTLPATAKSFVGTDGKQYVIPARAAAQQPTQPGEPAQVAAPAAMPTMDESGKIVDPLLQEVAPIPQAAAPAGQPAAVTAEEFEVVEKPTTVAGNIAAIRKARERALEIRKFGAQGPQYDILGPARSTITGIQVAGERALSVPRAAGAAVAQAIPIEMEAVLAGFEAIKKNRKVTMADHDILTEVLKYGQLQPEDEKLARGLLVRLEKKK